MKAKDFVRSKYPDANAYRWIYDNRLGRPTWVIIKGHSFTCYFYNMKGCKTESSAWVYAKNQILAGNADENGEKSTTK